MRDIETNPLNQKVVSRCLETLKHGVIPDFSEWFLQRLGFRTHSVEVLAKYCKKLIQDIGGVNGGGTIYLDAHSQSGEIVNNLRYYMNPQELKMLDIATYGSPIQLQDGLFRNVTNYVSSRDAVPILNFLRFGSSNAITHILPSDEIFGTDHGWNSPTYQGAFSYRMFDLNRMIFRE